MKILTFFDFGVKRRSHVGEVHPRTLGPVLSVEKKHCRETHSSNSGMMHQIHVGSNSVWHCLLKDNSLNEWTTSVLFRLKAHMHPAPGHGWNVCCVGRISWAKPCYGNVTIWIKMKWKWRKKTAFILPFYFSLTPNTQNPTHARPVTYRNTTAI